MTRAAACPDCEARLSADRWSAGLCLSCLLQVGLSHTVAPAGAGNRPSDQPTAHAAPPPPLAEGQILGDRVSGLFDGGLAVSPGEIPIHATWIYSLAGVDELPWQMSVSGALYGRQSYPTAEVVTVNRPDGLGSTQVLRDRDLDASRFPDLHLFDLRLQKPTLDEARGGHAGSRRLQYPEQCQHAPPDRRSGRRNVPQSARDRGRLVRLGLQLQF
jgi:hypothetical protein